MAINQKDRVIPLWGGAAVKPPAPPPVLGNGPRRFPLVSTRPRLPVVIPDEILDYYGWLFCQGGFINLHMTFEQFLAVIAAISPAGLGPEFQPGSAN